MKRSLAAALVAALFVVGVPAALATEEPPTTTTTTTTSTTTTVPTTTTTTSTTSTTTTTSTTSPTTSTTTTTSTTSPTTTAPTTTTTTEAPSEDPPTEEAPADEEIPSGEDVESEDSAADVDDPADENRVPKHQVRRVEVTRNIVFPVVGPNDYYGGFGACRDDCEREHHGIDIMTYGWKGVPVVAAHDGRIRTVRDDREWCIVEITADDRWYTRYVHLNNDTPGYDDEEYECLIPGIEVGERVEAGQIIGWIGDSGNAEWTPPHLHFEIRMPGGLPVDPYTSLQEADRIRFYRVDADDTIATAARIATYAYDHGSGVVNVMSTTDHEALQAGGFSTLRLAGPLLLSEPEHLSNATIETLEQLNASRVMVVGNGLDQAVIDQLELRFSIVDRTPMPQVNADSYLEPETSAIIEIPGPEPSPLSLVVVGDRSDLPMDAADDLGRMAWRMPTTVFESTEPGRPIGRYSYRGPGRSGTRNVLYFQTGDGYTRFRAREAPDTYPDYGVIVMEAAHVSEEVIAFLRSLADLPVMPLWR